jgi:hypothetical protein
LTPFLVVRVGGKNKREVTAACPLRERTPCIAAAWAALRIRLRVIGDDKVF